MDDWYVGAMNDGLFIVNAPPRPNNDFPIHDRKDGPTVILSTTELPKAKIEAIVEAHNAEIRAERERANAAHIKLGEIAIAMNDIIADRNKAKHESAAMRAALEKIACSGPVFDAKGTWSKRICEMAREALATDAGRDLRVVMEAAEKAQIAFNAWANIRYGETTEHLGEWSLAMRKLGAALAALGGK